MEQLLKKGDLKFFEMKNSVDMDIYHLDEKIWFS